MTVTFRVGESDFLSSPKTQIGPLQLLRHQSIELLRRSEACSHLRHREKSDINQTRLTEKWTQIDLFKISLAAIHRLHGLVK